MLDGLDQYKENSGYGKQLRETLAPFRQVIDQAGMNDSQAVQFLMNAHMRLTSGTNEQRLAAYQELGKSLNLTEDTTDPNIKPVIERLNRLEQSLTQREEAVLNEARTRVNQEVNTFASDPKHAYFDEIADDISNFIKLGLTLEDAYEKAVWANPVTRAKENARLQTEQEKQLKSKTREDAEKAKKAASGNIRSRDTRKAPTEPKGTMDETLDATLREIRSRTH